MLNGIEVKFFASERLLYMVFAKTLMNSLHLVTGLLDGKNGDGEQGTNRERISSKVLITRKYYTMNGDKC